MKGHTEQHLMLDWFKGLSDTNRIALLGSAVVPIIIALVVAFGRSQKALMSLVAKITLYPHKEMFRP